MGEQILDGTGKGNLAAVDEDNRLLVESKSDAMQHYISREKEQAYQCIGMATLESGTTVGLHIKNISSDKNMIITYMRHQVINSSGGTAFPNESNYFRLALGREYVSDGSAVIPINIFAGSGNVAEITVYQGNPTLTGTAQEIDKSSRA